VTTTAASDGAARSRLAAYKALQAGEGDRPQGSRAELNSSLVLQMAGRIRGAGLNSSQVLQTAAAVKM